MSRAIPAHPGSELLLRFVDDDLARGERELVESHIATCESCRLELAELREALAEYQQFQEVVLKPALPSAPANWPSLQVLAAHRRAARPPVERRWVLSHWWLPAAAAFAAIFLVIRLAERTPQVRAAELLHRAAAREAKLPLHSRSIRIQSRKHRWERKAPLNAAAAASSSDAVAIRRLLESAGYHWEDPLSAEAYTRWHDALAQKSDRVEAVAENYVIHTSTNTNPISDASLTLGSDLHAVACTLTFGASDTLEMTEVQDDHPNPPAAAPTAEASPVASAPPVAQTGTATPSDELHVLAALHRLGADLGEPIEVRREGPSVLVAVTGLDPRRAEQLKSALADLRVARVVVGEVSRDASEKTVDRPPPQVDAANPLLTELQNATAEGGTTSELADRLAVATDSIVQRVYSIRALARRFPTEMAAQMTLADYATLRGIIQEHSEATGTAVDVLSRLLRPVLPEGVAVSRPLSTWQQAAEALVADGRRLDQALNGSSQNTDARARKVDAAQSLADLNQHLSQVKALLRP